MRVYVGSVEAAAAGLLSRVQELEHLLALCNSSTIFLIIHEVATRNLSCSLQVWWAMIEDIQPLHVRKMLELRLKVDPGFLG